MASPQIVAVLTDLMFLVKIQQAAKQIGRTVTAVNSRQEALKQAASGPSLMILDLNCAGAEPLELIASLKSDAVTRAIPLLAFVAHVDGHLVQGARERGCDAVLARSAFSQNLPALLARYFEDSTA